MHLLHDFSVESTKHQKIMHHLHYSQKKKKNEVATEFPSFN